MSEHEETNKIVVRVEELMGVETKEDDISVSHQLLTSSKYKGKKTVTPIIAKFVRCNVKEKYFKGINNSRTVQLVTLAFHLRGVSS